MKKYLYVILLLVAIVGCSGDSYIGEKRCRMTMILWIIQKMSSVH